MPLVKLNLPQNVSTDAALALRECVHDCLVETCNVAPKDNFCLTTHYQTADMQIEPDYLGQRDPNLTVVIEIILLAGRSGEQKETLYRTIRERMTTIGFNAENAIIFLIQNNAIDWSFRLPAQFNPYLAAQSASRLPVILCFGTNAASVKNVTNRNTYGVLRVEANSKKLHRTNTAAQ